MSGRHVKSPDVVSLPSRRLLAVYCEADKHWAEGLIQLKLMESDDQGRTWNDTILLVESDRSRREPHWVTPRLSRLRDGRLAVLCDQDDFEHCHEFQKPGIYLWWSNDDGHTWSDPINTGVPGIEPDRMVELQNGRLAIAAHMTFADTQKLGQFVCFSDDSGQTWSEPVIIAKDAVHNYCEAGLAQLLDGTIVAVIRDNNHNNYPCQVAFSLDNGDSWTTPVEAPISGDRPSVGQVADGRFLVTYRNQGGNPGTYAWLGDITQELGFRCTGLHIGPEHIELGCPNGLHIAHSQPATTQYNLLPPESFRSEVVLEAHLRVAGNPGESCAFMQVARVNLRLSIRPEGLYVGDPNHDFEAIDRFWAADMTTWHTIRIRHCGGLLQIYLDGEDVLRYTVLREALWSRTYFGTATQSTGRSWWRYLKYLVRNPSEPEHLWRWDMHSGQFPDQYELDRIVELHANHHQDPDNGYSTWTQFEDGEILVMDYTNQGDTLGQAHIIGCELWPEDFNSLGRRSLPIGDS